jgi:hypothetical protein
LKTDLEFKTHISKLRKRIIWHWIEQIFWTTLLLALILNTIALGLHKLDIFQWEGQGIYPLLLLIAFALSLLHIFLKKPGLKDVLIDTDIRLGLKERLSTAYEYYEVDSKSFFIDRLIEEANNLLDSLRGKQIIPRHFSALHLMVPIFSVIFILLLTIDFTPEASERERAATERLKQIGVEMEKYADRVRLKRPKAKQESQKGIIEDMEAVARALEGESMTDRELLKSLEGLMNRSEQEKMRLTNRLKEELSLSDASNRPGLEALQRGEPTPADLARLKEELKELFDGDVPPSLSEDISTLAEHQEITDFFQETMDVVSAPLKKEDQLGDGDKALLAGRASEESVSSADSSPEKDEDLSQSVTRPKRKGGSPEEPKSPPPDDAETFFTAGREKAKGEKQAPYDLESPNTPAIKDKGVSGRGDRYNSYVRSLPAIGRAGLKEEEIIRAYQKELENVMRKEDIPLSYREYVKQYFLSIGMGKDIEGDGNTQ